MRQHKILKLYSNVKEPFYSFEPVDMKYAPDWDMYYEQWHQYETPLHIYFTDFIKLLERYADLMLPVEDAVEHIEIRFIVSDGDTWLLAKDYRKMIEGIKNDLSSFSEDERQFYLEFIKWLEEALQYTELICIESSIDY